MITPTYTVGDIAMCITDNYLRITKGVPYPVIGATLNSIQVYNDTGITWWYAVKSFRKLRSSYNIYEVW